VGADVVSEFANLVCGYKKILEEYDGFDPQGLVDYSVKVLPILYSLGHQLIEGFFTLLCKWSLLLSSFRLCADVGGELSFVERGIL